MFDARVRRLLDGPLDQVAARLDRPWLSPDRLTVVGLVLGLGSAGAAATQHWALSLLLWLLSRAADGLDGPLARRRRARLPPQEGTSQAGGFLDITADFVVYGATVVGVAVGAATAYQAPWWPFMLVLLTYYVNGAAFLAFSSIAERTGRTIEDGRSLSFLGGLAEGTETIAVHSLWLVLPAFAWHVAVAWAVVVGVSGVQRIVGGYRALG
jgi:phosphatidylglycerophosphate synthase